ncbi:MAG: alanine racemase [Candidatus Latescibacteria bacterium]|nr:alanine racemase [Candidatus Latescibacterota bacterium]
MRPTEAIIDLGAICHNISEIRKRVGRERKVLVAVKANAYGHGLVAVARSCTRAGVDMLGVAAVEEALQLRQHGIQCPVLIFNPEESPDGAEEIVKHRITATVYSKEAASTLSKASLRFDLTAKVHLNVDTGMGRGGLRPEEAPAFAEEVAKLDGLELEGIWTHFPVADQDEQFTIDQIKVFTRCLREIEQRVGKIPTVHAANSAATLKCPSSYFDMVRLGIAAYGLEPFKGASKMVTLVPALTLKSQIVHLKQVPPGSGVSYGRRFVAGRPTRIAVVPIGYADGYSRLLSGKAEALVRGNRVPVIGTICMDQLMVDVTDVPRVRKGDEVVLIGRQGSKRISAEELARKMKTINYEVVSRIGPRVQRVYVSHGSEQSNASLIRN